MGNLTLFYVTLDSVNSGVYGAAFGYNASNTAVRQLIILLRGNSPVPTSGSDLLLHLFLSSFVWQIVSLIQRSAVTNIIANTDYGSTCTVSAEGIFSFLA
ncbi:hypothetical protein BGZ83_007559 [Gryganskiella cystojenkinii]|nr:hypothetical protein BGZ83_007559 [Gryganskiella cystojenkinii]